MRMERMVAALSLALAAGACSKRQEPTASIPDDLKRDLVAAAAPTKDFAVSPQKYQRMRFVSDLEQTRATVHAPRPKLSRHPTTMTVARSTTASSTANGADDPMATMMSHAPATASTTEAPASTGIVVAAQPAPEPPRAPGSATEGDVLDHRGSGGIGGILGGLIGSVVIRGGRAGDDKCDPRTDGRINGTIANRPDFGLPVPTGQVFGGGGVRRR